MIHDKITSTANPKIKNIIKLNKPGERRKQGLFIVEGKKEIQYALKNRYSLHSVYATDYASITFISEYLNKPFDVYLISEQIASKISYSVEKEIVIALFETRIFEINQISLSHNPFILVLEKVEKPGNIGAILRTADAAGVDAVIICDSQTDIFNPNVIRSSRGTIFTVPFALTSNEKALSWLKTNKINIMSAALTNNALSIYTVNFKEPTAIVFGSESDGLSDFWLNNCDRHIIIPMHGQIDSLNVSVSAAIITFEAIRQRNA